jgi:hypothetical protein
MCGGKAAKVMVIELKIEIKMCGSACWTDRLARAEVDMRQPLLGRQPHRVLSQHHSPDASTNAGLLSAPFDWPASLRQAVGPSHISAVRASNRLSRGPAEGWGCLTAVGGHSRSSDLEPKGGWLNRPTDLVVYWRWSLPTVGCHHQPSVGGGHCRSVVRGRLQPAKGISNSCKISRARFKAFVKQRRLGVS